MNPHENHGLLVNVFWNCIWKLDKSIRERQYNVMPKTLIAKYNRWVFGNGSEEQPFIEDCMNLFSKLLKEEKE